MSVLNLQIAGEFIESDKKVYFADNFDLYFYENSFDKEQYKDIILSLQFITDIELENNKLESGEEFMRYECKADIETINFDLKTTNIAVPPSLVEEHIEKLTSMFKESVESSTDALNDAPDTDKLSMISSNMSALEIPMSMLNDFKKQLVIDDVAKDDVSEDDVENIVM